VRNREPRLTVRALRPLMSGLMTLGYDPVPFLHTRGIDTQLLVDPDATVPMSACVGLLADGVRATGDDNLGLHVAEHAELGSFDVHFYAMVSSPTLGAAFERLCRYQRLIHETSQVRLERSGDRVVLSHRLAGDMAAPRQTAELLLAAWVRAGRVATRTRWNPAEVRFAHRAPCDSREHERFFGAPLRFATGKNALVLPAALLDLPCRRTDPSLLALLDRYAADRLGVSQAATFADRARAALSEDLQAGNVTAQRLAAHLTVSVRTLHRSLAAEGTSYISALVVLIAGTVAAGHLLNAWLEPLAELRGWVNRAGGAEPPLFVVLFLVLNTVGVPLPVLAAAAGVAFGPISGATTHWSP
jgi:Arabinose-binding domain of AraC transcription regulator, N-term